MNAFWAGLGIGLGLGVFLAPGRGPFAFVGSERLDSERSTSFSSAHAAKEQPGRGRDPEEQPVNDESKTELREKMLDKTLADSFPTSDPPSSIPDPSEDDSLTA